MNHPSSMVQRLHWPEAAASRVQVDVLRLDLLHPVVSGNKWFKLQHHLSLAASANTLLTFGGAWSNHLVATAYAAQKAGLPSIGIIRGERPAKLSATLEEASAYGMQLEFMSRGHYKQKEDPAFLKELDRRFPGAYIIPEGGGGLAGITGSEDILRLTDTASFTHIACAIGTGTTFMGLLRASLPHQMVIGVPVLKGIDSLTAIDPISLLTKQQAGGSLLLSRYHFGGYARHPQPLLDFMNQLYAEDAIPTDIVYTGKLFYALRDQLRRQLLPALSRLLIIHSGGLQGNRSLPAQTLVF